MPRRRSRTRPSLPRGLLFGLAIGIACSTPSRACDEGSFQIFGCDASHGKKFIELCAPQPLDAATGFLVYRFGSIVDEKDTVELTWPTERAGSLQRFFASTYKEHGVYTQSVRFVSSRFGYRVFTRAKGMEELGAGVEVRDRRSGKTTTIQCSERPKFYIFDLKGLVPCDPETPVGRACL